MRKLAPILVGLLLVATVACSSDPGSNGTPTATPSPANPSAPAPQAAALMLELATPQNESVVTTSSVQVSGKTEPDAIVSVNGNPVQVDGDGKFSTTVTLEEGPNAIEVVASTFQNRKASAVLTVISNPS